VRSLRTSDAGWLPAAPGGFSSMPLVKTAALVLTARPLGDTSKIVTLLSPRLGVVRAVAKGARRSKARLAAGSVALRLIDALLYRREGRELDILSEAQVQWSPDRLAADWRLYLEAGRLTEVVLATAGGGTDPAADFTLLRTALELLEGGLEPRLVRLFHLKGHLLNHGLWPRLEVCAACGEAIDGPLELDVAAGAAYHPRHRQGPTRRLTAGAAKLIAGIHRRAVLSARQGGEVVDEALGAVEAVAGYHLDLHSRNSTLRRSAESLLARVREDGPPPAR